MSFTAIFIALLIERFFDCSHLRYWGWYERYQRFIIQKLPGQTPYILLAAIIIPLIVAVLIIELLTNNLLFGFIKLAYSILLILYCFGPRNLWVDMFACLNLIAEGDIPSLAEKLNTTFNMSNSSTDPQTVHQDWFNAIFIQANRRVFAIVFWFGFFGLAGVLFYRLISLSSQESEKEALPPTSRTAGQIESYLDWASIRVLTLLFALGGNFSRVLSAWRSYVLQGPESNDALLTECGKAALNPAKLEAPMDGSLEKEEISLLDRSLGIMLVIIAILVFLIP